MDNRVEITEVERFGKIIRKTKHGWEIPELGKEFSTAQEAEKFLKEREEKVHWYAVNSKLAEDFEEACKAEEARPEEKLEGLIENFIKTKNTNHQ